MSFDLLDVGGRAAARDVGLVTNWFGRDNPRIEEDVVDGGRRRGRILPMDQSRPERGACLKLS
jgi:hypothetical protein